MTTGEKGDAPRPARSRALLIVALAGFLLAQGYYGWVAVSQHLSHHTFPGDVGIIDDALSSTLHGEFMYSPLIGRSHFAVHFTPTLLLILPFYALYDSPLTLLLFQSVFLVAACVPIFLLTERVTSSRAMAVLMGALYVVNYYVAGIHLASHYEALLPFCLLMALYGAVSGRWRLYGVFLILALGVKTDVALYAFFLGLFLWLAMGEKRAGWITLGVSVAWFALAYAVTGAFAQGQGEPDYLRFWGVYGSTPGQIAWHIVTHPWLPFQALLSWRLAIIPATVGFLCLAHGRSALLILPPAAVLLLSPVLQFQHFLYYRSVTVITFVFFSAILGLRRLQGVRGMRAAWLTGALGLLVAANAVVSGTCETLTNDWRLRPYEITEHHRKAARFMAGAIPPGALVAAQWDLYCQLPRGLRKLPIECYLDADWVVIDFSGWVGQFPVPVRAAIRDGIRANFEVVRSEDNYIIGRRRGMAAAPAPPPDGR